MLIDSQQHQAAPLTRTGLFTQGTHCLEQGTCLFVEDAEASGNPDADTRLLQ